MSKNSIGAMISASFDLIDTMIYIIIGLVVALIGVGGWLIYLLVY